MFTEFFIQQPQVEIDICILQKKILCLSAMNGYENFYYIRLSSGRSWSIAMVHLYDVHISDAYQLSAVHNFRGCDEKTLD